jgi:transketolase
MIGRESTLHAGASPHTPPRTNASMQRDTRPDTQPDTYELALLAAATRDPRIVVLTAENRAAIRGLPEPLGARFIDVGICEQTMVGMAAGLALRGRIPIVHALAAFLTLRAFEFIRTDVGIAGLPVKLIGGVPGLLSEANGPTHQAIEDIGLMRGIPGMQVVCPSDHEELLMALPHVIASTQPCYLRFNATAAAVRHQTPFQLGKAEWLAAGRDVVLAGYGFLIPELMRAAVLLRQNGVEAGVLNLRTLAPVDEDALLGAARNARLLVTVEDHLLVGGLYSIVAELMLRHRVACRALGLGFDARWFKPALLPDVTRLAGLSGESIAMRVLEALRGQDRDDSDDRDNRNDRDDRNDGKSHVRNQEPANRHA